MNLKDSIELVLNNLKTIKLNKNLICETDKIDHKNSVITLNPPLRTNYDGIYKFRTRNLVCGNVGMYNLDSFVISKSYFSDKYIKFLNDTNFQEFDLMDSIAHKYLHFNPSYEYDLVYPVPGEHNWLNPKRWEYVDYLIAEFEYYLKHGDFATHNLMENK